MTSFKANPNETLGIDNEIVLVDRYLSGDQASFDGIKNILEPLIHSLVKNKKRFLTPEKEEDLIQECWVEVLLKLDRWDPARGPLRGFFYRCLQNCVLGYFRKSIPQSKIIYTDQFEDHLTCEIDEILPEDHLDITIQTRIKGYLANHILQRVALAIYLKCFDEYRSKLIQQISKQSKVSKFKIRFLVDYCVVLVRMHIVNQQEVYL